jgi:hypothetical protein
LLAAVPLRPANEGIECGKINYPDFPTSANVDFHRIGWVDSSRNGTGRFA